MVPPLVPSPRRPSPLPLSLSPPPPPPPPLLPERPPLPLPTTAFEPPASPVGPHGFFRGGPELAAVTALLPRAAEGIEERFVVRPAARESEGRRIFASPLGGRIFAAEPNRAVPMSSLRLAPAPTMPDRLGAGPRGAVGCGRPKTFAMAIEALRA